MFSLENNIYTSSVGPSGIKLFPIVKIKIIFSFHHALLLHRTLNNNWCCEFLPASFLHLTVMVEVRECVWHSRLRTLAWCLARGLKNAEWMNKPKYLLRCKNCFLKFFNPQLSFRTGSPCKDPSFVTDSQRVLLSTAHENNVESFQCLNRFFGNKDKTKPPRLLI